LARFDLPDDIVAALQTAPFERILGLWQSVIELFGLPGKAALGRVDRFYLLTVLLHRPDAIHPWLYERCREVESQPDDCLDLWAREHYKSTIITFAGTIQEMLRDPNITIGFFSHVRPIATKFLCQIKTELETNEELKATYPDVLWADPKRDASRSGCKWSEVRLDVKRTTNPKEGSLEAWGLVDGQPIGSHFLLRVYDDVVTRESVTSPEMVTKTTQAWELSDNLGARGVNGKSRRWHIGTRYSFADTYAEIIERGILKPRLFPATEDGTLTGKPVFLPPEVWEEKKITQRTQIAAQMLQNPAAGNEAMFRKEDLRFIDVRPGTLNVYVMVDPASSKKKNSDSTVIAVIGVDAARNKYLLDGYRQKMNLQERWTALLQIRRRWQREPGVQSLHVGYERFGMRSDLEYFEECMERLGESFTITELAWPQEGPGSKIDRIQRMVPDFGHGKFFLPAVVTREVDGKKVPAESSRQIKMRQDGQAYRILKPVTRRDHEGNAYSLNKMLLDEYLVYPFSKHDDFLDACSRLYDMDYQPPVIVDERSLEPEVE
jgi:phage terminase large subunit-like protein